MALLDLLRKTKDGTAELRTEIDRLTSEYAALEAERDYLLNAPLKLSDFVENAKQIIDFRAAEATESLCRAIRVQATGALSPDIQPTRNGHYESILSSGALGVTDATAWSPLHLTLATASNRPAAGLEMPIVLALLAPQIKANLADWLAPLKKVWPADKDCGPSPAVRKKRTAEINARLGELGEQKAELHRMRDELAAALS